MTERGRGSGWSRRGVLSALAALLAAPLACRSRRGEGDDVPRDGLSVVVIGAGMAGLSAARRLTERGVGTVIVLEARSRPGGRVYSVMRDGMAFDMGASWIHGLTGNPMTTLTDELGLARAVTDYERRQDFAADGTELSGPAQEAAFELLESVIEAIAEREPGAGESLAQAIEAEVTRRGLSTSERAALDYAVHVSIEHEFAAPAERLSAACFDEGSEQVGGDAIVPEGLGRIIEHLARGLDVRYDQAVTGVTVIGDRVSVQTASASYDADHVIVTAPLGVLEAEAIAFSPPLSASKREAIAKLAMGLLHKTWLRFDTAFWREELDDPFIGFRAPTQRFAEWMNLNAILGAPVLLGFNAGPEAERLEGLTDDEVVAEAMTALRQILARSGLEVPNPRDALVSRWGRDPFSRGSYSYLPVGACEEDRRALATVEHARLHFAGEHTSTSAPSTIHGAWLEGRRAADEV